jgi:penicillin amidase
MKRISFGFLFPLLLLVFLVLALNERIFQLPALGKLLNPETGAVQNERMDRKDQEFKLNRNVQVVFDDRFVPHIFAESEEDMYFAQGFVTASDRLWQMDFLSFAAAGRLAELFGPNFIDQDRMQRRVGILESSKKSLELIESDAEMKTVLDNYTAGVNSYIDQLEKKDYPIEYKLMGYQPEPWTNLKSILIMKYMAATLTGYEEDLSMSHMLLALGEEQFRKLYPEYKLDMNNQLLLSYDSLPYRDYIDYSFLSGSPTITPSNYNPRLGSNGWVVNDSKTKSGNAILSNDPHLNLSAPAIWYEMQLKGGNQNVNGFTIPGTPGVIIGYNEKISWGLTNGQSDVKDWYKLKLKDDYSGYLMDGRWKKTFVTYDTIVVRDGKAFIDTIYHTEHGPIVIDNSINVLPELRGFALKWLLQEPSNEFKAFVGMNRARNHDDFEKAIMNYKCPVQNFLYADTKGNIAMHHQGSLHKKWSGQGRFVLDGTSSEHLYKDFMDEELPSHYNPSSGYLVSANNNPFKTDDTLYTFGHYSELRASKISELLSGNNKIDVAFMKKMQLDNTNRFAELALPTLLGFLKKEKSDVLNVLKGWNCTYDQNDEAAILFEQFWGLIEIKTWDELMKYKFHVKNPNSIVLLNLIQKHGDDALFDHSKTNKKETAEDIIRMAYKELVELYKKQGKQKWGDLNKIRVVHLANLNVFGKIDIKSAGHPDAINAFSDNWGPSLRIIVEMKKTPVAYAVYAGGQSGNPGSKRYNQFVERWKRGAYYKMHFFASLNSASKKAVCTWKFN